MVKGKIKISIITVTFNSATTIADCISSVFDQTYSNIEHIIIDGASKDNTIEIINSIPNRVSKIISEHDKGIYDAMNKGIHLATGDIVGIINSDDFYHRKDIIAKIAKSFEDKTVQATIADVRFVNPENLEKTVRYYSSKNFSPSMFRFGFMPPHPSFFTYKKYFDEFGYYQTNYKIAADYELLIRFLYKHKLKYKYLALDVMKMRTGGASTASFRSNILLNKEIVRACNENDIYTNLPLLFLKYFVKVGELIFTRK